MRIGELVALVVVCVSLIAGWLLAAEHAPWPFVWRDVALVHLLAALPLASLLAAFVDRHASAGTCIAVAMLVLAIVGLVVASAPSVNVAVQNPASVVIGGFIVRSLLALGAAFSLVLAALLSARRSRLSLALAETNNSVAAIFLGEIVLLFVPSVYLAARTRNDVSRVQELLSQSRWGEASALVKGLLVLAPTVTLQGPALPALNADIDRTVRELERRVSDPIVGQASGQQQLDRARDLAILGRTDEALVTLDSMPGADASTDASTLRGTIHQSRGEWQASRDWYQRAERTWTAAPSSPEQTAGLARAASGIAFAERKLGRNAEAETAYLKLLSLSPTADTHFLLAQFYEDTQQTTKAHQHALRAMSLAPKEFEQPGQQLIDKLVTLHFGCWGL